MAPMRLSLPDKQNSTPDAHSPDRDVSRPLPAPPTDAPLVAPIPHSDTTIGVVRNWIGDINHDGDPTAPLSDERLLNCGPAAIAVFQRLAGTSHDARANTDVSAPDDLGEATGLAVVPNSREGIAQRLVAEGPGAHTTVVVHFAGGEQHAFNAFYDGTEVHAIDGQRGTVVSWPPQLDRVGNPVQAWFMGTPFHGDRAIFAVPDRTSEGRDGVPHRSVITGAAPSRGIRRSSTAPPSPSHVTGVGDGDGDGDGWVVDRGVSSDAPVHHQHANTTRRPSAVNSMHRANDADAGTDVASSWDQVSGRQPPPPSGPHTAADSEVPTSPTEPTDHRRGESFLDLTPEPTDHRRGESFLNLSPEPTPTPEPTDRHRGESFLRLSPEPHVGDGTQFVGDTSMDGERGPTPLSGDDSRQLPVLPDGRPRDSADQDMEPPDEGEVPVEGDEGDGTGKSKDKGKGREDAPLDRSALWDRYIAALNSREAALTDPLQEDLRGPSVVDVTVARNDLVNAGLDPERTDRRRPGPVQYAALWLDGRGRRRSERGCRIDARVCAAGADVHTARAARTVRASRAARVLGTARAAQPVRAVETVGAADRATRTTAARADRPEPGPRRQRCGRGVRFG